MLRRKPTALTISNEDINAFEEAYARKQAYAHYQKTGEDPKGFFQPGQSVESQSEQEGAGVIDPNDELKPLPGDKARIVRSREERIVGGTSANGR